MVVVGAVVVVGATVVVVVVVASVGAEMGNGPTGSGPVSAAVWKVDDGPLAAVSPELQPVNTRTVVSDRTVAIV